MDVEQDPTAGKETDPTQTEPDLSEPGTDGDVGTEPTTTTTSILDQPQPAETGSSGNNNDVNPDITLDEDGNVTSGNNTSPLIVDVGGPEAHGDVVGEGNPAVSITSCCIMTWPLQPVFPLSCYRDQKADDSLYFTMLCYDLTFGTD
jgi:hypothetical protein